MTKFCDHEYWNKMWEVSPYLQFPEDFQIKLLPANGADLRFMVQLKGCNDEEKRVSVYYDLDGKLGCAENYWEIYPDIEDSAPRFSNTPEGIKEMFDEIRKSLLRMEKVQDENI